MTNRLLTSAAGIAAVAALVLAPAAAADAHDYLVGSDPAADATVTTAIDTVTLTFNDRVLDLSGGGTTNLLTVTGPGSGARHFETGCATVADTRLSAPVALGEAGRYTVTYQIVSADGHTVSSSYGFAYQPPAGTSAAPGAGASPCGAGSSGDATSAPRPSATAGQGASAGGPATTASTPQPTAAASSGTDLGLVIGIAVAIVVLALIGVVIVVLTARRKPSASGGGSPRAADEGDDA